MGLKTGEFRQEEHEELEGRQEKLGRKTEFDHFVFIHVLHVTHV
jgi:hypothetical protein